MLVDRLLLQRKGKREPWERGCREGGPVTRSKFKYHRKWSRIQQAIVDYSPTGQPVHVR